MDAMNRFKAFSRRFMLMIFGLMTILLIVVDGAVYFCVSRFSELVPASVIQEASAGSDAFASAFGRGLDFFYTLKLFFVPATGVVFFMFAMLMWLFSRSIFRSVTHQTDVVESKPAVSAQGAEPVESKKEIQADRQRYFFHLIGMLQQEGRLVDFLEEDITLYPDEQVGAAVRAIHERCRKTLHKYVAPKPVIEKQEGERVVVGPGFDPGSIKLTGNVAGDPPFNGILRHPGWRAANTELPRLSSSTDFSIIAPAEVEIE